MHKLPLQLSEASGVPFYRQLVDQIAELIRAGQLAPGDRLPSVRELAVHTRVSLITVRRAYADLSAAGLILRRQGQGTFVSPRVQAASRAHAAAEARELLSVAVTRAVQLGMSLDEIREHVEAELAPFGAERELAGAGGSRGK